MAALAAVFFDGYGTLLHAPDPFTRAVQLLRGRGATAPEPAIHAALRAEMRHYRAHCHEARDEVSLHQLRNDCTERFREVLHAEAPATPVSEEDALAVLLRSFQYRLFDEVPPTLQALQARGLQLGVISNFDYRLPNILSELGLDDCFEFVLTSAEFAPKPAPTMFLEALRRVGVPAECACHVGDEEATDFLPAQRCGLRALLLQRGTPAKAGSIRELSELLELL